jgi:hypothetical protein
MSNALCEQLRPDATGKAQLELKPAKNFKGLVASENAKLAAQSLLHALGKRKVQHGKSMRGDIGEANVEAIGTMLASTIGKQKLAASQYVYASVSKNKSASADALATAEQLREIGSVVMLQRCWRAARARRRQAALKSSQVRMMDTGAALHLQAVWRKRQARKRLEGLKLEGTQRRAGALLQRCVRGYVARERCRKIQRRCRPHTAYLTLTGLAQSSPSQNAQEVQLVVSTYSADSGIVHMLLKAECQ